MATLWFVKLVKHHSTFNFLFHNRYVHSIRTVFHLFNQKILYTILGKNFFKILYITFENFYTNLKTILKVLLFTL